MSEFVYEDVAVKKGTSIAVSFFLVAFGITGIVLITYLYDLGSYTARDWQYYYYGVPVWLDFIFGWAVPVAQAYNARWSRLMDFAYAVTGYFFVRLIYTLVIGIIDGVSCAKDTEQAICGTELLLYYLNGVVIVGLLAAVLLLAFKEVQRLRDSGDAVLPTMSDVSSYGSKFSLLEKLTPRSKPASVYPAVDAM